MTRADLKAITRTELAALAREHQIAGWYSMRKQELVDVLARKFRRQRDNRQAKSRTSAKKSQSTNASGHVTLLKNGRNSRPNLSNPNHQDSSRKATFPNPLDLQIHAELLIHGETTACSSLEILGESIETCSAGTFSLKIPLEEGRQVIPAVMVTPDGREEQTVLLAIEKNTKQMEPRPLDEPLF
ncbi:MAG: hypothetical protein Tsb009_15070 [Planctomycetaceae bacterium]